MINKQLNQKDTALERVLGCKASVATCVVVEPRAVTLLHSGAGIRARIVRCWLVKNVRDVHAQVEVLDAVVHVTHIKCFPRWHLAIWVIGVVQRHATQ